MEKKYKYIFIKAFSSSFFVLTGDKAIAKYFS